MREIVRTLKQRVSLIDQDEYERICSDYWSAIKARIRSINIEEWYKNWVRVRLEAEDIGIAEIQGKSVVLDFLEVTETFLSRWVQTERQAYQRLDQGDQLILEQIRVLFIQEVHRTQ